MPRLPLLLNHHGGYIYQRGREPMTCHLHVHSLTPYPATTSLIVGQPSANFIPAALHPLTRQSPPLLSRLRSKPCLLDLNWVLCSVSMLSHQQSTRGGWSTPDILSRPVEVPLFKTPLPDGGVRYKKGTGIQQFSTHPSTWGTGGRSHQDLAAPTFHAVTSTPGNPGVNMDACLYRIPMPIGYGAHLALGLANAKILESRNMLTENVPYMDGVSSVRHRASLRGGAVLLFQTEDRLAASYHTFEGQATNNDANIIEQHIFPLIKDPITRIWGSDFCPLSGILATTDRGTIRIYDLAGV